MANAEIRKLIKSSSLYQYEVAEKIGVTECTLIRWLRKELPESKKQSVLQAIKELQKRGNNGNAENEND